MVGGFDGSDSPFSRRGFPEATGAAAGASTLEITAIGAVTADVDGLDARLLDWRSVEAREGWDQGFRGRPDRTLALTDSGISERHPDPGPRNDVTPVVGQQVLRPRSRTSAVSETPFSPAPAYGDA